MTPSLTRFCTIECRYAECCSSFIVMVNVIMLSFLKLNVIMLSAIMLSVIILSVLKLSVRMLNVLKLSVIMLSVVMLNALMLNALMLSVIMLSIIMLNVVGPYIVPQVTDLYFPARATGQRYGIFFLAIKSKTIVKTNYLYILANRHCIMNIILLIKWQYDKKKIIAIS
jgi:hypothetical protein